MEEENINSNNSELDSSNSPAIKSADVLKNGVKAAGFLGGPVGKVASMAANTKLGGAVLNGVGNTLDRIREQRGVINNDTVPEETETTANTENTESAENMESANDNQEKKSPSLVENAEKKLASNALSKMGPMGNLASRLLNKRDNNKSDTKDEIAGVIKSVALKAALPYIIGVCAFGFIFGLLLLSSESTQGGDLSVTHRDPDGAAEICYNYDNTLNGGCDNAELIDGNPEVQIISDPKLELMFPNGIPTNETDMQKYLTSITVTVKDKNGNDTELTLNVHQDLASTYQSIFQDLYEINFPVDTGSTYTYSWRSKRKSNSMSMHSYGLALDLNPNQNGGVYGSTNENSPYYNNSEVVSIFKNHGFYWGGDWSSTYYDPMHFSYINQ